MKKMIKIIKKKSLKAIVKSWAKKENPLNN